MPKKPKNKSIVRDLRTEAKLTQKEFASLVGVSHAYYRQLETGHHKLSPALAQRIALATGCGLEYPPEHGIRLTVGQTHEPFTREYYEHWRRWKVFRDDLRSKLDDFARVAEARVHEVFHRGSGTAGEIERIESSMKAIFQD